MEDIFLNVHWPEKSLNIFNCHIGMQLGRVTKSTIISYDPLPTVQAKGPKAELKIRGGIQDNSKIIFLISQQKRML